MKRQWLLLCFTLLLFMLHTSVCHAQQLSWESFLDELADETSGLDEERTADWDALVEELMLLHEQPIDLNRATRADLGQLFFLSETQIGALLDYRARYGSLHSMGELLLIPDLDWHTRQVLHLFAFVGEPVAEKALTHKRDSIRHEAMARIDVPFYKRQGWTWQRGLANQWRWETSWGQKLQAGIRAETDAGEPMFSRQIKGWDAMGGYVQVNNIGFIKTIIAGDYKVAFGEGVVASNTFILGKNSIGQWQGSNRVRPHRSSDENNFMRGGTICLGLPGGLTLTAFYSIRKLDATIRTDNTVSTIASTGLHRTAHELEQRHALTGQTTGGHLAWNNKWWQFGATGLFQYYNHVLEPGTALYQQIAPRGYKFGAVSVDYGYRRYPFSIHGETARSINAGPDSWASVNQLSVRFGPTTQLSVLQRFYGRYYFSPYANSMAENSSPQNESGLCLRFDAERLGSIGLSTYADLFYSPWPRYTMSRFSRGGEGMMQLKWSPAQASSLLLRYQVKSKERSDNRYWSHRLRLTGEHQFSERWLMRLSANWNLHKEPIGGTRRHEHSSGFALSPQAIFKSKGDHWRWTAACTWFHTDDYNSRIYVNEPRLQGTFSFPNLSGHGLRIASLLRWQPSRRWQISALLGCTRYFDRDAISSTFLQIRSPWKTDLSLQARIRL